MSSLTLPRTDRRSGHAFVRGPLRSDLACCVWIPLFALRCEEAQRPELASRPVALLAPDDSRRLWLVSAFARRTGVRPGMTVGQAIGLCASLILCEPDPVRYDEQFARLLLALSKVSPVIEPAALGRAYVGMDGLEKLFGPPECQLQVVARVLADAWGERVSEAARRQGEEPVLARLGWGRGKFTAWVAATRAAPGEVVLVSDSERIAFLASQPLAVLPLDPDHHRRLRRLGLKTLGDLVRLPQEAVVSQFGREGRQAWRLAAGVLTEQVVGRDNPEPIVVAIDFPLPLADRPMLVYALERLIAKALTHPRRTGWRIHALRARAGLEHGTSWMAEITYKDPSADASRLLAPLQVRLEHTPPQGAVEHLAVEFTAFAPGTSELQLFARDAASAARAGRQRALRCAASEIRTRFKRTMLARVVEVDPGSRIPERRYALVNYEP